MEIDENNRVNSLIERGGLPEGTIRVVASIYGECPDAESSYETKAAAQ